MSIVRKFLAEVFGTFWLVFGGCGSAVLAANFLATTRLAETEYPYNLGIGLTGVALAFGLTVMTMAYAIGHVSGCHLNPAVSIGLMMGGRFSPLELIPYIIAQVVGAVGGAVVLFFIANGKSNWEMGAFACNGFDDHSPGKYNMMACFIAEAVLTFFFLIIILGSTDSRAPAGFAGIAIGLGLTLIHLVGIPITNLSVNPARSTGPALVMFQSGRSDTRWPVEQLWLFWAAPVAGAALAGIAYRIIAGSPEGSK